MKYWPSTRSDSGVNGSGTGLLLGSSFSSFISYTSMIVRPGILKVKGSNS